MENQHTTIGFNTKHQSKAGYADKSVWLINLHTNLIIAALRLYDGCHQAVYLSEYLAG